MKHEERKADILERAHAAAAHRRHRRYAGRGLGVAILIGGVAWFAWPTAEPTPATQPPIAQAPTPVLPEERTPETPSVSFIQPGPLRHVALLSDDQLLDTLADNDLDAGLAYVDGKAVFVPQGWTIEREPIP